MRSDKLKTILNYCHRRYGLEQVPYDASACTFNMELWFRSLMEILVKYIWEVKPLINHNLQKLLKFWLKCHRRNTLSTKVTAVLVLIFFKTFVCSSMTIQISWVYLWRRYNPPCSCVMIRSNPCFLRGKWQLFKLDRHFLSLLKIWLSKTCFVGPNSVLPLVLLLTNVQ